MQLAKIVYDRKYRRIYHKHAYYQYYVEPQRTLIVAFLHNAKLLSVDLFNKVKFIFADCVLLPQGYLPDGHGKCGPFQHRT